MSAAAELPRDDQPVPARPEGPVLMLAAAQLRATADMLSLLADQLASDQTAGQLSEILRTAETASPAATDDRSADPRASRYPDESESFAGHLLKIKLRAS